jgi:hypothetical protein
MAKIRLGDFGNRIAPVGDRARVGPQAFVFNDGGVFEGLERQTGAMVNQERAIQRQEIKESQSRELQLDLARQRERFQEEQQAKRNKAAASFASYQVDLETLTTDLGARLLEGGIKREDAQKELEAGILKLKKQHVEPIDPETRGALADNLIRFDGMAKLKFDGVLRQHVKQEGLAALNQGLEAFQRMAVRDPANAVRQANMLIEGNVGILGGADKAQAARQRFEEGAYVSHFTDRLNQVRYNAKGLQTLERDIAGNQALDPDKKNILLGRIGGFRETLAARAERAERSRLASVQHQIEAADKLILAGFEPSAQQLTTLQQVAKGTPYEPVVQAQIAFANQTAEFRAMRPRAQESFLTEFEAKIRKNPTPDGVKTLDAYRTIAKNQQELVRDDPISFAGQKGLADIKPIDFTQIDALKDQLLARVEVSRGMRSQYGAPLKVLTKQEAATLNDFMRRSTADDKTKLLGALKSALPDAENYTATMQQIAPDSPVTAWAGSLMNRRPIVQRNLVRPDIETQGAKVAQLMLRGEALLNPTAADRKEDGKATKITMPKERDLVAGFENVMGDAYRARPDAFNVAMQGARAVYAALAAEDGDYSGEYKAGRWQRAVELATGGATDFNGAKVARPYGMRDDEFKDAVFSRLGELVAQKRVGLTQQQLSRMQLESAGDARYLVRSGTGYLLDKSGAPVTIDLMSQSVLPEGLKDAAGKPVADQVPR